MKAGAQLSNFHADWQSTEHKCNQPAEVAQHFPDAPSLSFRQSHRRRLRRHEERGHRDVRALGLDERVRADERQRERVALRVGPRRQVARAVEEHRRRGGRQAEAVVRHEPDQHAAAAAASGMQSAGDTQLWRPERVMHVGTSRARPCSLMSICFAAEHTRASCCHTLRKLSCSV
eukprot:4690615-Pleurochrysis_carterae.AAC.2